LCGRKAQSSWFVAPYFIIGREKKKISFLGSSRGFIYFRVSGNYQVLEEFLNTKLNKLNKLNKFLLSGFFSSSLFDLVVNFFFKARCFSGNFDVEKAHDVALGPSAAAGNPLPYVSY
jgi:hypothetical protein